VYLLLVRIPFNCATNHGVLDSSLSTDTQFPGPVTTTVFTLLGEAFVLHGILVMAPNMHPTHFGGCTLDSLLVRIPNTDISFNLAKDVCPSL
jgi:hypothetical protein